MYSNGIMGLNAPVIGQNDVYPGSNQSASEYATSAQTPVSSSAINAGYEPRTDAYSGQMMARGGIASIRRFEEGGPTQGNFDDSGNWVEAKPTYSNDDNGNLVDKSGTVVATKEARDDPYINPIASDPTEIQSLFDLKTSDPKQFYSTVADKLNSVMTEKYQTNSNYDNEYNQLQKIKEIDPESYYKNQLGFRAHQMGWQVGQNRGERNTANQEEIKGMIPEAQKAGLSTDQIDSIVNQNFSQARNRNVQRIASELEAGGSGFSFQKDVQPMWPVLAAALTAGAAGAYAGAAGAGEAGAAGVGAADAAGAGSNVFSGLSTTGSIAGTAGSQLTAAEIAALQAAPLTTAASTVPSGITALEAANVIPQMGPTYAELGYQGAGAKSTLDAIAAADAASKAASATPWLTPTNAARAGLGLKLLSGGAGGAGGGSGGGGAGTQVSTQSSNPTYTTTTSTPTRAPAAQSPAMVSFPTMSSNQNMGSVYNPYLFNYQTRNAAQGGLMYAQGGISDLGGYAAGGKLLKGPGDGMSDSIVANIGGQQPARLADGEFVIPADVVSHLGNGSTDAGAKHLYKMMDKIRRARTGNPKQGKQINADKFLPRN